MSREVYITTKAYWYDLLNGIEKCVGRFDDDDIARLSETEIQQLENVTTMLRYLLVAREAKKQGKKVNILRGGVNHTIKAVVIEGVTVGELGKMRDEAGGKRETTPA